MQRLNLTEAAANLKSRITAQKQVDSEYQELVGRAAKLTGMKFIVQHKRLEKAFADLPKDRAESILRSWVHQAEKADNPGKKMNWLIKVFNEQKHEAQG